MRKLFLDIDGVLLGRGQGRPCLAVGAEEFIAHVVDRFDCYWLSTHCQGDARTAQEYLRPYVSEETYRRLQSIKPTRFDVLKTDALPADEPFLWIEDRPLATEIRVLEESGRRSSWLKVDVSERENVLMECLELLKGVPGE